MTKPTQEKQVTKRNIANQISSKYEGVDSDFALKMVEETFEIIIKSLEEGKTCAIREFGRFYTHETKATVRKSPLIGVYRNVKSRLTAT
jgi:nucleoid DNA-binding protein